MRVAGNLGANAETTKHSQTQEEHTEAKFPTTTQDLSFRRGSSLEDAQQKKRGAFASLFSAASETVAAFSRSYNRTSEGTQRSPSKRKGDWSRENAPGRKRTEHHAARCDADSPFLLKNLFGREQTPCGREVRPRRCFSKETGRDITIPSERRVLGKMMVPRP